MKSMKGTKGREEEQKALQRIERMKADQNGSPLPAQQSTKHSP
jgi:hypothetical protein